MALELRTTPTDGSPCADKAWMESPTSVVAGGANVDIDTANTLALPAQLLKPVLEGDIAVEQGALSPLPASASAASPQPLPQPLAVPPKARPHLDAIKRHLDALVDERDKHVAKQGEHAGESLARRHARSADFGSPVSGSPPAAAPNASSQMEVSPPATPPVGAPTTPPETLDAQLTASRLTASGEAANVAVDVSDLTASPTQAPTPKGSKRKPSVTRGSFATLRKLLRGRRGSASSSGMPRRAVESDAKARAYGAQSEAARGVR